MSSLVDVIKKIGIFMLAAQAVIHFAPGQKYEKYIKLIVGIIILVQFIIPINKVLGVDESEWSTLLETTEYLEVEKEFEKMVFPVENEAKVEYTMVEQLEEEVKSKLNNLVSEEKYRITDVTIGIKQSYELESIQVEIQEMGNDDIDMKNAEGKNEGEGGENKARIEQVQVDKIVVGEEKIGLQEDNQEIALQFRKEFSEILGIQEEKMEVILYGTDEEVNG